VIEDRINNESEDSSLAVEPLKLGPIGWIRWMWRQLITMRVALQLLFLLAVASVPGSVYPQRPQSLMKVNQYIAMHPQSAPWLDRLGMFDVYGSPWFSAIYLLLMISLVGCIVPRARVHWRASRSAPPAAPRNLTRLNHSDDFIVQGRSVADVSAELLPAMNARLQASRWRTVLSPLTDEAGSGYLSVERGYLRETGNLVFHLAIIGILVSVAFGQLFGYRGQIIVREKSGASNVLAQYDSFHAGRLFNTANLIPFNIKLNDLKVTYETEGKDAGTARDFKAVMTFRESANSPLQSGSIGVNSPLDIGGASVFLIGHGYAPHVRVTDANGNIVFDDSVIFLPQDANFTSTGVVKVPDMQPQLGIQAIFAPTGVVTTERGPHSLFPDLIDPKLFMSAWVGDLGLDTGVPQNVYELDKTKLKRIDFEEISPGESWKIKKNAGTVTFVGVDEFATFNIASDPGQNFALAFALLAIVGITLSLYIQRRRAWIRVVDRDGVTTVEIGALSRYEDVDLSGVVAHITSDCAAMLHVENPHTQFPRSTPPDGHQRNVCAGQQHAGLWLHDGVHRRDVWLCDIVCPGPRSRCRADQRSPFGQYRDVDHLVGNSHSRRGSSAARYVCGSGAVGQHVRIQHHRHLRRHGCLACHFFEARYPLARTVHRVAGAVVIGPGHHGLVHAVGTADSCAQVVLAADSRDCGDCVDGLLRDRCGPHDTAIDRQSRRTTEG